MAKQGISTGTTPNDGTGDSLLDGALKINANFTEIYDALGDGSTVGSYANFTGVVTATSFDGELTGSAVTSYSGGLTVTGVTTSSGGFVGGLTGNVTGTATTATVAVNAQGLTGNPSITVGNINVGTAITIGSGNTQTTNSIELTGTIDSVSVITDRLNSGIATFTENVYLGDSDHLYFGDGNDLDIYHSGTDNFIVGSTGVIHIRNDDIKIQSGAGNTEYARFRDVGVELYQGTYKRFETTSAGVLISGGIEATGVSTFLGIVEISSGIITATTGIVTYYGDGSKLDNIISGVGIQSSGTVVGSAITTLNFIGAGNTFSVDGSTVNISIQGGGGSSYWSEGTLGISTSSYVGIGTTNPIQPLQVGAAGTNVFVVNSIGDVGIGTTNPDTKLHVVGDINLDDGGTYATTLQMVTATANRTISFPDATGTVALVAGSSGQVTYNSAGIQSGGNLSYDSSAGTFGYGTGRGTVTQSTNKSTGVTLNAPCGAITMNSAGISSDTTVSFTLTNSSINTNDLLILNHISGGTAGAYTLNAQSASGSASINVRNVTSGTLSEAIVIGFAVIKS